MKEKVLNMLRGQQGFVSGQQISDSLGVSRTAVWKSIRQLEAEGYRIQAVRNRGYRLESEPDLLTADQIGKYMTSVRWAGRNLKVCESVDSTNNVARQLAEEGEEAGTLVVSEIQTAGRGRMGRPWISPKGSGIWMSLVIRPDIVAYHAPALTLVMALAVCRAIRKTADLDCKIKWPNDIVIDGKKVCGILTEMSADMDGIRYIVIGVGINVLDTAFSEEIQDRAISVSQASGHNICRAELIAEVMKQFEDLYEKYLQTEDMSLLQEEYNHDLVNIGRRVRVLDPKGAYQGTALGIDQKGDLLVRTKDQKMHVIASGEVSVRGIYGYV